MGESTAQPYFTADFGEHGGRFNWSSHEEITQWVSKLQNDWMWVRNQQHNPTNNAWQAIANGFNAPIQALNHASNYKRQNQEQQAQSQLSSARSSLETFIRTNPWLLPDTPRRLFIERLRDSGQPLEAALIVANWMAQDFNNGAPIRQSINALLTWELYERGIKDRMKTENAALKRLAGDMQSTLTQFQESEHTQIERFDQLHSELTEQKDGQQTTFDAAQTQRDTQWQEKLSVVQKELDQLKSTYDQHMALAAPVAYWESKRTRHKWLAIVSFVALLICMLLVGWFLHAELKTGLNMALEVKASTNVQAATQPATTPVLVQGALQSAATWQLGAFLLMATLGFWFIRLLVRIFLSNLHLENDAAERCTMAKTYLALLRNGDLPKDDSIGTILAALFRPTGDGIVKDEGLPPTAMEWMTRLGGK
ncbi:protein of unknown function [Sterolibacterium denitrificans]|uniref:DUF6161 domain-containing protein n=1 Tax=Sterolibacterium denitrificans TaxID=157592 RepID=A0A7Z7HRB8_9PROT|nr:DUF6161 domain-containing protein [Sterolibacterium denitrificans]SMB27175.1 protein of unknown function [Sterolibacterium denitrificans]